MIEAKLKVLVNLNQLYWAPVWGESLYKSITFFIHIASMEEFLIQILKRNTSQPLTTWEQKNSFSFFDLGSYIITSISNDAHNKPQLSNHFNAGVQDFGTTLISSMLSVKLQLCKTEQVRSSIYSKGRKDRRRDCNKNLLDVQVTSHSP